MIRIDYSKKINQYWILLLVAIIWGSSFMFMKKGLESFTNYEVAFYRMFIASFVLIPFGFKNWPKFTFKKALLLLSSGLLGSFIPAILFTTAQTRINSSLAGMLNAFVPVLAMIMGYFFFKQNVIRAQIIGAIISIVGVFGLLGFFEKGLFGINSYALFIIVATICYALNVNILNKYLKEFNGIETATMIFTLLGPLAALLLFQTDFFSKLNSPKALINLGYISVLGIFGTALATIIFNNLLKNTSPVFASSSTYIIPIVAVLWGVADHEYISFIQILSMALILAGVMILNRKK